MTSLNIIVLIICVLLSGFCACAASEVDSDQSNYDVTVHDVTVSDEERFETVAYPTELPSITAPVESLPDVESSLDVAAGSYIKRYDSNEYGDYLDYYIHIPENAVIGMPLIVYLHGDGEVNRIQSLPKNGISAITKEIYGDSFPFILLEPNTRIESWTKGNIPKLLFETINTVVDRYEIDTDKIILTGFSRGAIGVWDMISIYGGYFSAAVPVSSPHQKGHIDYIKAAEVPVWTFAGNIGDIERWYHEYLKQNVDIINGCHGFGKFTVLYGCNHSNAKYAAYVKETFDWMLAQTRGVIPEE